MPCPFFCAGKAGSWEHDAPKNTKLCGWEKRKQCRKVCDFVRSQSTQKNKKKFSDFYGK